VFTARYELALQVKQSAVRLSRVEHACSLHMTALHKNEIVQLDKKRGIPFTTKYANYT